MARSTMFYIFLAIKIFILILLLNSVTDTLFDKNFIKSLMGDNGQKLLFVLGFIASIALIFESFYVEYKPRKSKESMYDRND